MSKQVVVIAGPAGSGKNSVAKGLLARYPACTMLVTATTRPARPGEEQGVNYYFFSKKKFQEELAAGNIPEHYHRTSTDTYYGTYKPDLEAKLAEGKIVIAVVQIVGARYLKKEFNATTIFIMPPDTESLERRIRARAPMSDVEWEERLRYTQEEVRNESGWYDYRITNEDGKLDEAIDAAAQILTKEGFNLA